MTHVYSSPNSYYLIYAYAIPGSVDHGGLLKIGDTKFSSTKTASELTPGCPELVAAARTRIDAQTGTAGIKYNLVYTELAARMVGSGADKYLSPFRDYDVHDVLERSGFKHRKIRGTKGREWFKVDLETLKKAIKATKEGRVALNSSELAPPPKFEFRQEQEEAIERTVARFKRHYDMLWDAKMRFGKTAAALEVVLRGEFRRTIIITHRPVVETGWQEDYQKIFPKSKVPYEFVTKFSASVKGGSDAKQEAAKKDILTKYDRTKRHFIYFASIQDLRGSKRMGGEFLKNDAVFDMEWDLVIVDEAHEGTQTELGQKVADALKKKNHTCVLSLSGTPFNIRGKYDEDAVFVWDYTMEQATKLKWETEHPGEPNPYAMLPRMNIYTFDLAKEMSNYAEDELEGKAFNFTEFFRTWTGDKDTDGRPMPAGAKEGDFIHAGDVEKFLDLISTESDTSRYPFATSEYCNFFRHTLWMVPGVAAAKALSAMLKTHKAFKACGIANVAGNGDDYEEIHYEDALAEVRDKIKTYPRTITLSCGKLTTGVTVPEWTAVLMLAGSVHTAASSYMQTIFRVQSPWVHDGQRKEECYVFDFAPDRTLTVLTETAQLSRRVSKKEADEERGRKVLGDFINFCPVISLDGGHAKPYDVKDMMRRLKHIFVLKAIRNGFDDPSIYNNDKLLKLGKLDLMKFNDLERIVGKTKQTESPNSIDLAHLGFDKEEFERKKKEKEKKLKRKLTPEEDEALKKHREELQKARDARSILRAISIRMPLLIYGADVPVDESITIEKFVRLVDEASWEEFMPKGITKKRFRDFIEYYDKDVFEAAGLQIRRLAKAAEKLSPGQRVQQIARIFSYFKNPDKETVLTPWRVVNMHLSDTLGGWCFFDEAFSADPAKMLEEPRHVDRGEVTKKVFRTDAKILEINSKSGLYPLYMAYSLYRARCGDLAEDEVTEIARIKKWREVIRDNVFIICKTPMAVSITRRTLVGYSNMAVNARCFADDLVETLRTKPEKFTKAVSNGKYWDKEEEEMKFDAVVGNPPYQVMDKGNGVSAMPLYNHFVSAAKSLAPSYISMIMPARWYAGGKGLDTFRDSMLADKRIVRLVDFQNAKDCFPTTSIGGGCCYFLRGPFPVDECLVVNFIRGQYFSMKRRLDEFSVFVRYNESIEIMRKVLGKNEPSLKDSLSPRNPFGLPTNFKGRQNGELIVHVAGEKILKANLSDVTIGKDYIPKWKLMISRTSSEHAGEPDASGRYNVISTMKILKPKEICSDTYIVGFPCISKTNVTNALSYLRSRFVRFLILQTLSSINLSRDAYRFVPLQDFSESWDDAKLYKKYKITSGEQRFIESMIKPME